MRFFAITGFNFFLFSLAPEPFGLDRAMTFSMIWMILVLYSLDSFYAQGKDQFILSSAKKSVAVSEKSAIDCLRKRL
ncbi:MAG: hypothetical protein CR997_07070 [Acidobacteria bacterium]|nr:MAG: hypothetical protein CR997_07070 [Acidobacteriota bacterium]